MMERSEVRLLFHATFGSTQHLVHFIIQVVSSFFCPLKAVLSSSKQLGILRGHERLWLYGGSSFGLFGVA